MKITPILYSSAMINAQMDGRKTQTRRIIKPQPYFEAYGRKFETESERQQIVASNHAGNWFWDDCCYGICPGAEGRGLKYPGILRHCPYGQAGDLLLARETMIADYDTSDSVVLAKYAADRAPVLYPGPEVDKDGDPDYGGSIAHWDYSRDTRPSIHMHRWASRLTDELTEIRIERLQDISQADAMAEGITKCFEGYGLPAGEHYHAADPRQSYFSLWEFINGEGSVEANPWVWVLCFKVHKMNADEFIKQAAA